MLPALVFALLQPPAVNYAAPSGGDTTGYWQQRASYTIVATLDEAQERVRATGTLVYVNNSPDTLREFYVHQHLNAFRPGSRWSEVDEREGRVRFQRLEDPDYAYERFTAVPTFDGVPVRPEYPGAPDSTVVRFALPRALLPGDTLRVQFAWDARPSTLPRRQGRRGRSYDFAQWYPRVAVYDRRGWNPNPLVPAGEFYGEFGDFDVTLLLRDDQVLGTTGVVTEGDPGWERALRWGVVARRPNAYRDVPPAPPVEVPAGARRLRVIARDVHHFGWSVSPDYRYEGGYYLRPAPARPTRFRVWDSVAVHALYQPGDEATWGRGQVVTRTTTALAWLEQIFGPYAYPQMTVLHRIEGGGTEFPMLQMNGSPSYGLNLHEGGHVFIHGILANNEWLAGWIDEGFSSYQSGWAQGLTRPEQAARGARGPRPVTGTGYAARAIRPRPEFAGAMGMTRLELSGRAEPLAVAAHDYSEFAVYNAMVYSRGEMMWAALRDAMGDDAFRRFLHILYDRWALRHIDEVAIRAAAEHALGRDLGWFFEQWIHRTGVLDYALSDVRVRRDGDGWVTTARLSRQGDYGHPMPVGVQVDTGWVIVRGAPTERTQTVTIRTSSEPQRVELDPLELTPDWYRPNDQDVPFRRLHPETSRLVFDWPLLEQSLGSRYLTAATPLLWYSRPGGLTVAGRLRSNYQGDYDQREVGLAITGRVAAARQPPVSDPADPKPNDPSRFQGWFAVENPKLFGAGRPLMGVSAGVWRLDGITLARLGRSWDASRYMSVGPRVSHELAFTGSYPFDRAIMDGRRWSGRSASDVSYRYLRTPLGGGTGATFRAEVAGGAATGGLEDGTDAYGRAELAWSVVRRASADARLTHQARLYGGVALDAPVERGLFLSARTPTETFTQHWWRPDDSPLAADDVPYVPLGGGGLRGYDPFVGARGVVALNLEEAVRLAWIGRVPRRLGLYGTLFGDAGMRWAREDAPDLADDDRWVADAGVGLALRGRLFDRDVRLRLDLPLWVRQPGLAVGERGRDGGARDPLALRWGFSFADLW